MTSETESITKNDSQTNNRKRSGHLKQNCRIVYVAVPNSVFNHAKAQAYLSGLSWPKFVEHLLSESSPISK